MNNKLFSCGYFVLALTTFAHAEGTTNTEINQQKLTTSTVFVDGTNSSNSTEALPGATSDAQTSSFSENVALYSQYIYRGLAQSNRHPSFQFGIDYNHTSGFYLGAWASTITWIRDSGAYSSNPSANMEIDIYGGLKRTFEFNKDLSYDIGFLRYNYPGSYPSGAVKPDTNELYGTLIWKWLTAKYSYSLGNTFGVSDARGTSYIDLTATFPLTDDVTLTLHAGRQEYKGNSDANNIFSYNDFRGEISKNLSNNWQIGFGVSDTTAKSNNGSGSNIYYYSAIDKNIGATTGYIFVKKVF